MTDRINLGRDPRWNDSSSSLGSAADIAGDASIAARVEQMRRGMEISDTYHKSSLPSVKGAAHARDADLSKRDYKALQESVKKGAKVQESIRKADDAAKLSKLLGNAGKAMEIADDPTPGKVASVGVNDAASHLAGQIAAGLAKALGITPKGIAIKGAYLAATIAWDKLLQKPIERLVRDPVNDALRKLFDEPGYSPPPLSDREAKKLYDALRKANEDRVSDFASSWEKTNPFNDPQNTELNRWRGDGGSTAPPSNSSSNNGGWSNGNGTGSREPGSSGSGGGGGGHKPGGGGGNDDPLSSISTGGGGGGGGGHKPGGGGGGGGGNKPGGGGPAPAKPGGGADNWGRPGGTQERPLLLDLDGDGIEITELSRSNVFVDAGGDGLLHRTAWAGVGDGVLFFDANGDNRIGEKREYVLSAPHATTGRAIIPAVVTAPMATAV